MNLLSKLNKGDYVVKRLVAKYLLARKLLFKLKNQELITKRIDEIHFPHY